jgi:hypothetical protein
MKNYVQIAANITKEVAEQCGDHYGQFEDNSALRETSDFVFVYGVYFNEDNQTFELEATDTQTDSMFPQTMSVESSLDDVKAALVDLIEDFGLYLQENLELEYSYDSDF